MIEFSICLIVTASPSRISSTQAASHGAGHSRPVNSGKLLVACSCAIASWKRSLIHEVVPVGDQVAQWAAVVAERNPAVHAARALVAQLLHRSLQLELAVVADALTRIPLWDPVALDLQEAAELAHQGPASPTASSDRFAACPPLAAAAANASSRSRSRSTRL